MAQIPIDTTTALKTIAGISDLSVLQAAGINTVEDYIEANIRVITRLTKQRSADVKSRQQAAGLYFHSGLDPALSLRLASAGVKIPCQLLFDDDMHFPIRGEWEKRAVQRARINIAFDNFRHFLLDESTTSKEQLLGSLSKLTPQQKGAANRSFDVLRGFTKLRWLDAEVKRLMQQGFDGQGIEQMIAAASERQIGKVLDQLRKDCEVK